MARTLSIVLIILLLILTSFLIVIFNSGFFDSVGTKSSKTELVFIKSQENNGSDVLIPISATKLSGSAFQGSSEEECG